ncbi:MAG TPA: type II toxin-antitoxin system HicA family toxin [Rhizomicrobium sp.]|nr:type II toxin-antitoxin system HicA family toxin [Rhizomicrobium sp.]
MAAFCFPKQALVRRRQSCSCFMTVPRSWVDALAFVVLPAPEHALQLRLILPENCVEIHNIGGDMGNRGTLSAKEVVRRLNADGWTVKRRGPGDHVQFVHPTKPGKVTVDMGARDIPTGTLRSIFRQAGWIW